MPKLYLSAKDMKDLLSVYNRLNDKAVSCIGLPVKEIYYQLGCKRCEESEYVADMSNIKLGFDMGDGHITLANFYEYGSKCVRFATHYSKDLKEHLTHKQGISKERYRRMYMNVMSSEIIELSKLIKRICKKYDITPVGLTFLFEKLEPYGLESVQYNQGVFRVAG